MKKILTGHNGRPKWVKRTATIHSEKTESLKMLIPPEQIHKHSEIQIRVSKQDFETKKSSNVKWQNMNKLLRNFWLKKSQIDTCPTKYGKNKS